MVPMAGQDIVRLQLSGTFHAQAGWLSRAMHKPYSQACENNKDAILEVLSRHLDHVEDVLEIGSGTGQHAVYFAEHLPHLTWRTSDQAVHHEGIRAWIEASGLSNVLPPLTLDVTMEPWPVESAEAVFSANTAHIMSWPMVEAFVSGVGRILARGGLFLLYGPNGKVDHHGENASNYKSAEFDGLFGEMKDLPNGEQRQRVIDRMVEILRQESPWLFGFNPKAFSLHHAWYGNAKPHLMANNTLKYKKIDGAMRAEAQQAWNRAVVWPLWLLLALLLVSLVPAVRGYRQRERSRAL